MPWIMEVKVNKPIPEERLSHDRRFELVWVPVKASHEKVPYHYETKDEAGHMLRICYPDQLREFRLGATQEECGVRVRQVTMEELEELSK